ncbi:MAG TPA: hypothetical protein VKU82_15560, partial [Planctomycetaceae bacterium]|nr:hypothetical protein [Planctomycetaceae bacterium]
MNVASAGSSGAEPASAAGLICYEAPGGENYFALSLKTGPLGAAAAHDHAILIDTSASQTGAHREQSFEVLKACLAALSDSDRVRLFAVDVDVKPLMDEFSAPRSHDVEQAMTKLLRRVPLGSTDLRPALETALATVCSISPAEERGHSIIYIGDGMSTGKLIEIEKLGTLLGEMRKNHVPINCYAVGPRTDLQLLGTLAEHTGGVVFVDSLVDDAQLPAKKLGQELAAAADAAVFYPDRINLTPAADQLFPHDIPPLRSDRATIVLGKGRIPGMLTVVAARDPSSRPGTLEWSIEAKPSQSGNTFLVDLWSLAEKTDGVGVAVAGDELLNLARGEYEGHVLDLVTQGRRAVASRNLKRAEQIAHAVRQVDPANVEVETILTASQKVKAVSTALSRESEASATAKNADLIDEERSLRAVRAEKLDREVRRNLEQVQKHAGENPDAAIAELKRTLTAVASSTDIDPDIREKLRARVQSAIDRALTLKLKADNDRILALGRASAASARELAVEQIV